MKTSSKMLFFLMTLMSTIMVVSSSNWMNMWIGLEINLMSFIPLMFMVKNSNSCQSSMMYFLTQSMASMIFMVLILMSKYLFINSSMNFLEMMIMITMMIKMGMPPFHMWFPEVMNKMSWPMCFMLMTWQKVAPMYILSMTIKVNNLLIMVICLSALIGAIGGMNQTSTRKIMAYSSINHMSWLVICAAVFKKSWTMYMVLYTMMMLLMSMMLHKYNIFFINQMNIFFKKNVDKMIIILMMLSVGGLPPFLGFLPKWITIQYMISSKEFIMMLIMMTSALITLSYYIRMSTTLNLMMTHSQKWMSFFKTDKSISMYLFLLNMMMPLIIFTMNFY